MDSLCILLSVHDRELDDLAEQIQSNCGYCMMQGHLLRQGNRIPHAHIRNCYYPDQLWIYCMMQRHLLRQA